MLRLRATGTGDGFLRSNITAIAIGAVMVTGHCLCSGRENTAGFLTVDMDADRYLLRAAFCVLVGTGTSFHRFLIATIFIMAVVAALFCHRPHRYIGQYHNDRQQNRQ